MAEGKGRERWAHTALVCCILANAFRDPKKRRPYKPDDFNPYAERACRGDVIEVTSETAGLMREAFTGRRNRR